MDKDNDIVGDVNPNENENNESNKVKDSIDESYEVSNEDLKNNEESNVDENKEIENFEEDKLKLAKKKKVILLAFIGVVAIVGVLAKVFTSKYNQLVYPGTKLYTVNISKLNDSHLSNKVSDIKNNIGNNEIKIISKNHTYDIRFKDLIKSYNENDLEKEVMSYGKDGNLLQKFGIITIGVNRNYTFNIEFNDEAINELVDKVYDENSNLAVNPKISINKDNVEIKEGKVGNIVDKEFLASQIKEIILSYDGKGEDSDKIIQVTYIKVDPDISVEDLKKVDTKISSYSTEYGTGGGRGKNIEVAASKIDDLILMPGEEFSYENTVGPVTQENGYFYAPVISNGQLVQGIGGGVCQVSSTMYNAQLMAGILPTERRNHSKAVSYVPRGLDATLASGSIDYKFKNTYDYPIVINSYTSGGNLYIEFWSNKDMTKGLTYEAVSYVSGNVANTYLYGYDLDNNKVYEKHIDTSIYR